MIIVSGGNVTRGGVSYSTTAQKIKWKQKRETFQTATPHSYPPHLPALHQWPPQRNRILHIFHHFSLLLLFIFNIESTFLPPPPPPPFHPLPSASGIREASGGGSGVA